MQTEHCYVFLRGHSPGNRIGIVTRGESGFALSCADQREWNDETARQYVYKLNTLLWITPHDERELREAAMPTVAGMARHALIEFFEPLHRLWEIPMRIVALVVLAVLAFVILAVPADALSYAAWTAIVAAFVIGCVLVATHHHVEKARTGS